MLDNIETSEKGLSGRLRARKRLVEADARICTGYQNVTTHNSERRLGDPQTDLFNSSEVVKKELQVN